MPFWPRKQQADNDLATASGHNTLTPPTRRTIAILTFVPFVESHASRKPFSLPKFGRGHAPVPFDIDATLTEAFVGPDCNLSASVSLPLSLCLSFSLSHSILMPRSRSIRWTRLACRGFIPISSRSLCGSTRKVSGARLTTTRQQVLRMRLQQVLSLP